MRSTLSKVKRAPWCLGRSASRFMAMPVVHENLHLQCFNGFVSCWNARTRHTVASQTCRTVHLHTCVSFQTRSRQIRITGSATLAFRRLYHAGKEPELVMQFQIPEPTLWDAKGSYDRFQFELSTGTSTNFCRTASFVPADGRLSPFHLQCRSLTDQPFWTLVTEPASRVRFVFDASTRWLARLR